MKSRGLEDYDELLEINRFLHEEVTIVCD